MFFKPNLGFKYFKSLLKIDKKFVFTKMKLNFDPNLKGMKVLNRDLFKIDLKLPVLKVTKNDYLQFKKLLRNYTFEAVNLKRYQDLNKEDPLFATHKYVILDPESFNLDKLEVPIKEEISKLLKKDVNELKDLVEDLSIQLSYNDLKFDDVMKAIIPDEIINENVNVKGYSIIGHIAHFNLRDQVLDYKNIIGEVLLDKLNHIKTVVNKVNEIDNTFRNFKFEILAGEKSTLVQCKENNCEFKFDFAHVYWNPRLGTEHERVVNLLNPNDVVYDVFAGVGPFSVPAVSNRRVSACLSNDLNPNSYKYLLENFKNNNKSKSKLKELEARKTLVKRSTIPEKVLPTDDFNFDAYQFFMGFNLDGREFIRTKVKYHLIEFLNYRKANKFDFEKTDSKFYVLMNLPAMSVEFLDSFVNLYTQEEIEKIKQALDEKIIKNFKLNIFCYHFCKGDESELKKIQERIRHEIYQEPDLSIESKYVRKVAPNKDMFCTMFKIDFNVFFSSGKQCSKNKAVEDLDDARETKIKRID